jgi:hypothetical protein
MTIREAVGTSPQLTLRGGWGCVGTKEVLPKDREEERESYNLAAGQNGSLIKSI